MKKNVLLVFGGKSAEHEVSLRSAKNIFAAMDLDKFNPILVGISKAGSWYRFANDAVFSSTKIVDDSLPAGAEPVTLLIHQGRPQLYSLADHSYTAADIAFPIIHGTMGEDGTIQGLFKMMQLPFVGCGVWASAAGMDKEIMKRLLKDANIPSAKYLLLTPDKENDYDQIVAQLGTPFFIKPANAGSSVGVHKVKTKADFKAQLADAFQFDFKVLAEEFIQGREIECSVMGLNHSPKASLPGEVVVLAEFYSYEAKYIDENGARIDIPANLSKETVEGIQALAQKTFTTLGCDGLTRVDFFIRSNGSLYINEINTLPGFTKISMYPKMWEASGVSYKDLVTELISLGFERFKIDSTLKTSYLE